MKADYAVGGIGYGEFKQRLFEAIRDTFVPMRARRDELVAQPELVDAILARGAERARDIAVPTFDRVKRAVGLG